jgi:hypothetical protein
MSSNIFSGCIPALMTPCRVDRTPDFAALVRKGSELIAAGMSAVVYCGSMGDWPLLTDEQRMRGVEALVEAGIPVIVGTGATNSAKAIEHAAHAQKVGANGLMVIPRVLSRGSSMAAQRAHFKGILSAAPIFRRSSTIAPTMASRPVPICSLSCARNIPTLLDLKSSGVPRTYAMRPRTSPAAATTSP